MPDMTRRLPRRPLLMPLLVLFTLLCCVPVALAASYDMRLSTLVLANGDADLAMVKVYLNGVNTHYVSQFIDLPLLETAQGPLFSSIVITSDQGEWGPGDKLTAIRAYAQKYNVRIAFLNTKNTETLAGTGAVVSSSVSPSTHVGFDSATIGSNPAMADIVNEQGRWAMTLPYELNPIPFEVTGGVSPAPVVIMRFGTEAALGGGVAAAVVRTQTGTEELHFAFNAAFSEICAWEDCGDSLSSVQYGEDTMLTLALANVWFTWVTRGVFLGQRRSVFQLHVDDWYCATQLFNTFDETGIFRINSDDVDFIVDWQKKVLSTIPLPAGSSFTFEPAYNGANFMANSQADAAAAAAGKSLSQATMKILGEFNWISHTWTHQNLDWATPEFCNGERFTCPLAADRMNIELSYNQLLGDAQAVIVNRTILPDLIFYEEDTPASALTAIPDARLSRHSLVTPEISGLYPKGYTWDSATWPDWRAPPRLDNKELHTVFKDRGITCVTGDNSRPELVSTTSSHHPVIATSDRYTVTGLTIIPRHALSIAFNAHDEDVYLTYYNYPGGSQCWGTPGPACSEDAVFTYDQAMDRQAYSALYYLLQYRQDPYMFHQANLHAFALKSSGRTVSHLTYFAEKTFTKFLSYVNKMPITSPKMDDTCQRYRDRLQRDTCNPSAYVKVTDGQWHTVRVQGAAGCTSAKALLTVRRCNHQSPVGLSASYYGMDATFQVAVSSASSSEYSWAASGDSFGCVSSDAPILYGSQPATSSSPASGTTASTSLTSTLTSTDSTATSSTETSTDSTATSSTQTLAQSSTSSSSDSTTPETSSAAPEPTTTGTGSCVVTATVTVTVTTTVPGTSAPEVRTAGTTTAAATTTTKTTTTKTTTTTTTRRNKKTTTARR